MYYQYTYMKEANFIAIIDFGSQYTHLIARNLRELGVANTIYKPTVNIKLLSKTAGIILSGGPNSVITNPIKYNSKILSLPVPILGICYGLQLLAHKMGGKITPGKIREYGLTKLHISKQNILLQGVNQNSTVWMSHGDSVTKLPKNFVSLASTTTLPYACLAHTTKPIFGLQFHPEVHHTKFGQTILKNFIFTICKISPTTIEGHLEKITTTVKSQVGNKKVFLLVSGGVDSTVAFALLNKILGPGNVYGLHIDTGLMRLNESREAQKSLNRAGFKNLHIFRAGLIFLKNLKNISDPETKRKIIGQTFLDVKCQVEKKLKLNTKHWLLGQGTIYPDTIESGGTRHADKIKTHHNRIGILTKLAKRGLLVEPLKELYKDEVRELGLNLGLPPELINTHPFPGPGLGVRILCLSKTQTTKLNNTSLPAIKVNKYPSRILPLLSVGVQGDERSYRHPLAVSAPYKEAKKLHKLGTHLVNKNKIINRILLTLNNKNINLGVSREAYITPLRVKVLQQIDDIVIKELKRAKIYYKLWQCPVVLIPFGYKHGESIVLRPFESREAMTGQAFLLPPIVIKKIVNKIEKLHKIDYIFYDLTNKPPGTVEWE